MAANRNGLILRNGRWQGSNLCCAASTGDAPPPPPPQLVQEFSIRSFFLLGIAVERPGARKLRRPRSLPARALNILLFSGRTSFHILSQVSEKFGLHGVGMDETTNTRSCSTTGVDGSVWIFVVYPQYLPAHQRGCVSSESWVATPVTQRALPHVRPL